MYNMTNITAANNWYEIGAAVNTSSGGLFFTFLMVILTISYWTIFKKQDFKTVFLAGSFFTSFIAVLLFAMKYVAQDFLVFPLILFFAALILKIFADD